MARENKGGRARAIIFLMICLTVSIFFAVTVFAVLSSAETERSEREETGLPHGVVTFEYDDHACVLYEGPSEAAMQCWEKEK